jgi:hypothetical protein
MFSAASNGPYFTAAGFGMAFNRNRHASPFFSYAISDDGQNAPANRQRRFDFNAFIDDHHFNFQISSTHV